MKNYNTTEVAKMSALSSGEFHKFKYLTDEEVLPSDQSTIIEQTKTIENQSE